MRLRDSREKTKNDDERILPLINVVFLLLIFFMLAGQLAASDPFTIEPPKSLSEGPAGTRDMMILISSDGRFALDGIEMSEESVIAEASARKRAEGNLVLRLKADGETEAASIVTLMQRLRKAGFKKLGLLTIPKAQ